MVINLLHIRSMIIVGGGIFPPLNKLEYSKVTVLENKFTLGIVMLCLVSFYLPMVIFIIALYKIIYSII